MTYSKDSTCPVCGQGTLSQEQVEDFTVTYKGHSTVVHDLKSYTCGLCEEGFYDPSSEKLLNREFADLKRTVEGFLTSEQIKGIRKKYQLSQRRFSELLGMAPKTIARYELGIVVQNKSTDRLMRLVDEDMNNLKRLEGYTNSVLPLVTEEQASP